MEAQIGKRASRGWGDRLARRSRGVERDERVERAARGGRGRIKIWLVTSSTPVWTLCADVAS